MRRRRMITIVDLERRQRIGWGLTAAVGTFGGMALTFLLAVALAWGEIVTPRKVNAVWASRASEPHVFWFFFCWWALFAGAFFHAAVRSLRKLRGFRKSRRPGDIPSQASGVARNEPMSDPADR